MPVFPPEETAEARPTEVEVDEPVAVVPHSTVAGLVVLGADGGETCSHDGCW